MPLDGGTASSAAKSRPKSAAPVFVRCYTPPTMASPQHHGPKVTVTKMPTAVLRTPVPSKAAAGGASPAAAPPSAVSLGGAWKAREADHEAALGDAARLRAALGETQAELATERAAHAALWRDAATLGEDPTPRPLPQRTVMRS